MSANRSREALAEFLEYVGAKGLMPQATVQARRAASSKILAVLEPEEATDVTSIDVDHVMTRFHNLEGKKYTPGSLATYRSRLLSTLDDFRAYLESPISYRPNNQARQKPKQENGKREATKPSPSSSSGAPQPVATVTPPPSAGVIPIPIRSDLVVQIHGIPFDLSRAEAQRVANVILALAND
ncbi:Uncharacterised protein [Brevundimonas vesicularis]|uniref:Core-binding (CB) domain-containing protein n=1 Tax=Brevundimonas vesicularis TaxID=41276 RepID=A0A2X1D1N5_BREVE|nr:hypothetical protein [Brevundimonas vesicularis]SPU54455.1 Uncharacterised protein [Brevundimonas vesicularis]